MEVLLLIAMVLMGITNILCFVIGAKVGQKVSKGETIEMPNVNPMEAIRREADRREAEKEQSRIETILYNIDNYNGTSAGQKDVPR